MRAALFGWILLLAAPASAMHPLGTDDAGTLGAGAVELELASRLARPGAAIELEHSLAAHAGLGPLDLGFGFAFGAELTAQLDLKLVLVEAPLGLALRLDYLPPIGAAAEHAGAATAIASATFGALSAHANLGVHAPLGAHAALSLQYALEAGPLLAAEVVLEELAAGLPMSALLGVVWPLPGGLRLSAGAGPFHDEAGFGFAATLGLTLGLAS